MIWTTLYKNRILFFSVFFSVLFVLMAIVFFKNKQNNSNTLVEVYFQGISIDSEDLDFFIQQGSFSEFIERIEPLPEEPKLRTEKVRTLTEKYAQSVRLFLNTEPNAISVEVSTDDQKKGFLLAQAFSDAFIHYKIKDFELQNNKRLKILQDQLSKAKQDIPKIRLMMEEFSESERYFLIPTQKVPVMDSIIEDTSVDFVKEIATIDQSITEIDDLLKTNPEGLMVKFIEQEDYKNSYEFIRLMYQLKNLQLERFLIMADEDNQQQLVETNDEKIAQIKFALVKLLKNLTDFKRTSDDERDLALFVKRLFLETRQEIYYRLLNRQYGVEAYFTDRQKSYVMLEKSLFEVLKVVEEMEVEYRNFEQNEIQTPITYRKKIVEPEFVHQDLLSINMIELSLWKNSFLAFIIAICLCFIKSIPANRS
jgi:hypothetical protein